MGLFTGFQCGVRSWRARLELHTFANGHCKRNGLVTCITGFFEAIRQLSPSSITNIWSWLGGEVGELRRIARLV